MDERFSPCVDSVLRASGWTEGRQSPSLDCALSTLQNWGLPRPSNAIEILSEFNGLQCRSEVTGRSFRFGVSDALHWFDPIHVPIFEWAFGEPACPIGYGERSALFLGKSGAAFWLHDELIGFTPQKDLGTALHNHFTLYFPDSQWIWIDERQAAEIVESHRKE